MKHALSIKGLVCAILASQWLLIAGLCPGRASTGTDTDDGSAICRRVAQQAAMSEGVPQSVMLAITLSETGRKSGHRLEPWPWTVNLEGKGYWFSTESQALSFAESAFERGARSFDVGCFQINFKWHGQAFASIREMFDPQTNARYAARFLKSLYAERGSWPLAAGAYHSQNPEFAGPYAARFERLRNNLVGPDTENLPELPAEFAASINQVDMEQANLGGAVPENNFPLLKGGEGAALASLVPVENGLGGVLIGAPDPGSQSAAEALQ